MAMAHGHLKHVSAHVSRGNKNKYRMQIRSVKNLEIGPVGFPDVSDDQKLWNLAPTRPVWFSAHFVLIWDQLGQGSSEIISSGAIWNHLAPAFPRELFYMAFEETQVHQQAQSKCRGWTYTASLSLSLSLSLFLSLMQCIDVAVKHTTICAWDCHCFLLLSPCTMARTTMLLAISLSILFAKILNVLLTISVHK